MNSQAVRVEDPDVFNAVHQAALNYVAKAWVDGVRIDHVDGLSYPGAYLTHLRERLDAAYQSRPQAHAQPHAAGAVAQAHQASHGARPYLVVEKILADDEALPAQLACRWHHRL